MTQAACRGVDPELFFAEKNESDKTNEAKMICFGCPVRVECDDYRARSGTKHGVWGGKLVKRD